MDCTKFGDDMLKCLSFITSEPFVSCMYVGTTTDMSYISYLNLITRTISYFSTIYNYVLHCQNMSYLV